MKYIQFWNSSNNDFECQQSQEEIGFMQKVQQKLSLSNVINKVQDVQQAATNWKNFAIFFGIGCCFLIVSLTFLPMVMLFPAKFGGLFSLGSISIMISLFIIKGGKNFIKMFCNKDKWIYSSIYILFLISTCYFSLIAKNYVLVIISSIAQMIALAWLFASSFPAGLTGMKFISKQIFGMLKQIMQLCFKTQSSTFLPI